MATLLIIDDDEFTREVLRELLEAEHSVNLAVDGRHGLALAGEVKPDLIICDIRMPLLDGFGVLKALREHPETASTPFLFLSAASDPELHRLGRLQGADEFLIKPVRPDDVLATVADRLRRASKPASPPQDSTRQEEVSDASAGTRLKRGVAAVGAGSAGDSLSEGAGFSTDQRSLLFVQVWNFDRFSKPLEPAEIGWVLTGWHRLAKKHIESHHGWIVEESGDSLLAQFDSPRRHPGTDARYALDAAVSLVVAARSLDAELEQWLGARLRQRFCIRIVAHRGEVALAKKFAMAGAQLTVVGAAVNAMTSLRQRVRGTGLTLSASRAVLDAADVAYLHRAVPEEVSGAGEPIVELLGIDPATRPGPAGRLPFLEQGTAAIEANNRLCGAVQAADAEATANQSSAAVLQMRTRGYQVVREINAGGMARIYLVRDERSDGLEILKVLSPNKENPASSIREFLREFSMLSRIMHPQVVSIYDQWFADGLACIAMEYLPGGDLRQALAPFKNKGLQLKVVTRYMKLITTGLSAIHEAGIVHGDLKPGNIMLRIDGSPVITDFGIAQRLARPGAGFAAPATIIGTVLYMSPEQLLQKPLGVTSDLYSLGIMFYELLTGQQPFTGPDYLSIGQQHLTAPIPILPPHCAEFQPIIERLLAKNPADRFSSALEVRDTIDLFSGAG